jgi:hypothetical protein
MSDGDLRHRRLAHLAACEAAALSKVAPVYTPAALPDGHDEIMAAHSGLPSIAQQSASHGAPLPAIDRGA